MTDSEQPTPVTRRTGIIFEGGYLKHPYAPVEADVEIREDVVFLGIRGGDRGLAGCLGLPLTARSPWQGNGFLEYLIRLRNEAVHRKLCELIKSTDNGDTDNATPTKRPRRAYIDEVPKVLPIIVEATEHYPSHTMDVLPSTTAGAILWIDAAPENIDFLARAVHYPPPKRARKARVGYVDDRFPAVKSRMIKDKEVYYINYFDEDGEKKSKTKTIPPTEDETVRQQLEAEIAAKLQAIYDKHSVLVEQNDSGTPSAHDRA